MGLSLSVLGLKEENIDDHYFSPLADEDTGYFNYLCDECGNEIIGTRFSCIECLHYDSCLSCKQNEPHPHPLYQENLHPQAIIDKIHKSPSTGQALLRSFEYYAHRLAFGFRPNSPPTASQSTSSTSSLLPYQWITFKEVGVRVNNIGNGLRRLIPPRTFVGLCSHVQLSWYLSDYACQIQSMICPVIGPNYSLEHIVHIVKTTEMELVFASQNTFPLFLEAASHSTSLKFIILLEDLPTHLVHPKLARARAIVKHHINRNSERSKMMNFAFQLALDPISPHSSNANPDFSSYSQVSPLLNESEASKWQELIFGIPPPAVLDLSDLEILGSQLVNAEPVITKPDELETLTFTSGSTGVPKGAMFNALTWKTQCVPIRASSVIDKCISWSVSDRINDIMHLCYGGAVGVYNGDMAKIFEDLAEVRPHQMNATPSFWNKIYAEFKAELRAQTSHLNVNDPIDAKEINAIRKTVMESFSGLLGGRCERIVTGGAPTSAEVISFLWDCFHCPVAESYGTTEMGGISTRGLFVQGLEWKLEAWENYTPDDLPHPRGELCVKRANHMMQGYWKNETETSLIFDSDGFYHTGDIVELNQRRTGATVVDRKKNIFKLSQGEYVAPAHIEGLLLGHSPFIKQVFVYGDSLQPSLIAVIVPHLDLLRRHLKVHAPEEMLDKESDDEICLQPTAVEFLVRECARVGSAHKLRPFEIPAAIHLTPTEFSIQNGLLTQTAKPSRHALYQKFKAEIEKMYDRLVTKRLEVKKLITNILGESGLLLDNNRPQRASTSSGGDSDAQRNDASLIEGEEVPSFVQVGGDSLTAIKLRNIIKKTWNVTIPVQLLLDPTTNTDTIANFISAPFEDSRASKLDATEVKRTSALESSWRSPAVTEPRGTNSTVFLTGCSGFLGTSILFELLSSTTSTVYCLMRPKQATTTPEQLYEILACRVSECGDLDLASIKGRVKIIAGSLDLPHFGLSEGEFDSLSETVDVVIHAGALVNSVMPYQRMHASNVEGTRTCIELCSRGIAKFLLHVSSTSVLGPSPSKNESKILPTDLSNFSGYTSSKYISELLVWEAIDQKFPATIVRPGFIGSSSSTGFSNVSDFDNRFLIGITKVGKVPESSKDKTGCYPLPTFPVDYMSKVIVKMTQHQSTCIGRCFNLENHQSDLSVHLITQTLQSMGFGLQKITFEDWKLLEIDEENPIFTMKEEFFSRPSFPSRYSQAETSCAQSFIVEHMTSKLPETGAEYVQLWVNWLLSRQLLQFPKSSSIPHPKQCK